MECTIAPHHRARFVHVLQSRYGDQGVPIRLIRSAGVDSRSDPVRPPDAALKELDECFKECGFELSRDSLEEMQNFLLSMHSAVSVALGLMKSRPILRKQHGPMHWANQLTTT